MLGLTAVALLAALAAPQREVTLVSAAPPPFGDMPAGAAMPATPPRLRECLASGDCALAVWAGVAGPAAMSFWVRRERWERFGAADRDALRRHLAGHVARMRAEPAAYVAGPWRDAWRSPDARSGPPLLAQVRRATAGFVVLSPGRGPDGRLLHGREIHAF